MAPAARKLIAHVGKMFRKRKAKAKALAQALAQAARPQVWETDAQAKELAEVARARAEAAAAQNAQVFSQWKKTRDELAEKHAREAARSYPLVRFARANSAGEREWLVLPHSKARGLYRVGKALREIVDGA